MPVVSAVCSSNIPSRSIFTSLVIHLNSKPVIFACSSLKTIKEVKMALAKKECSELPSKFNRKEKFGSLQFFSVDRNNRWPVQGWSSGDEVSYELDEEFVAEECAREFNLDKETRWPLQGWCKASKTFKTRDKSVVSIKPSVPSRWPQGW